MIHLHGTKTQITREGIVSVWRQYYVDDMDSLTSIPLQIKSLAGSDRLDLVEIASSQAEEGVQHVATAKYEGVSKKFAQKTYAWSPEEAQSPMQANPNFNKLAEKYHGRWDKEAQSIIWDEEIPVGKSGKTINPSFL